MNIRKLKALAISGLMVTVSVAWVGISNAASLYKWVDENGNVTYQDTPPPNNVEFEETQYTEPGEASSEEEVVAMEEAARLNPVSLYTVPSCEVCDLVRLYLEKNQVPFAEKNVQSSISLQNELEDKSGSLTVPTLVIGDLTLDGYSRSAITNALKQKGFPLQEPEQASADTESDDLLEETQAEIESSEQ